MGAHRRLGPLVAAGRTAEVFGWRDGTVIKLVRPGFEESARHEATAAERVTALDLPAPRFCGTERVGDRTGLVYERVDGVPMVEAIVRDVRRSTRLAADLAELHVTVHARSGEGLPPARQGLAEAVRRSASDLEADITQAAQQQLDTMPDGNALLHGDFHPGNVVLTDTGPVVIDWLTAASGAPGADVARTLFLLRDAALDDGVSAWRRLLVGVVRRRFADAYLRRYLELQPIGPDEVRAWRLPILAARMAERVDGEQEVVRGLLRRELRRSGSGRG